MSQSKIVITGSSGMIGTALTLALMERGHEVIGNDIVSNPWSENIEKATIIGDIRKMNVRKQLPEDVDVVIHLAANSRVPESVTRPASAIENIEATYGALEYARSSKATKVLLASSREVYGDIEEGQLAETEAEITAVKNPYGASKVGSEALIWSYQACYGIEVCSFRLSNIYGRYDVSDRVFPTFIDRAIHGQDLVVYGEDKVLDFLYIDDCIEGIVTGIEQFEEVAGETVNLGSGVGTSLLQLANAAVDAAESNSDIRLDHSRRGEVEQFVADISKAERLLNFTPDYSLQEGLPATVEWYKNCDRSFGDTR